MKPLNTGDLGLLKNLSIIKRCPLLGGSLTKIVTFGTKHFVPYSRHVRYWEVSLYSGTLYSIGRFHCKLYSCILLLLAGNFPCCFFFTLLLEPMHNSQWDYSKSFLCVEICLILQIVLSPYQYGWDIIKQLL